MNFPDDDETPPGRQAEDRLIHSELSREVIGAAMTVSRTLGPGLREKTYERALCLELTARGIPFSQQERFEIRYAGQVIDTFVPDLVVDNAIIVDTKVVAGFDESHDAPMMTYLSITGLRLALLLNFKHRKVTWKRIIR